MEEIKVPLTSTRQTSEVRLDDVISAEEVARFRDLGLGRGVDATNPNMWANKSPFIMMHICQSISNMIGTEESGIKQYFTQEVSSLTRLQTGIKLSLNEPSSQVKVGINAENSRSKSSTRKTIGAKVHTRTVSFRTDLSGLPKFSLGNKDGLAPFPQTNIAADQNFENQVYSWILDCIYTDNQAHSPSRFTEDEVPYQTKLFKGETPINRLSSYLETLERGSPQLKLIASYCDDIVKELGITHYVNAIELGAMAYQSFTLSEYEHKFGAGVNIGVDHLAQATVSGKHENKKSRKSTKVREIGKISKDRDIMRDSSEEAVIGFQIQPIHKLVQLKYIQVALQKAVKDYIEKKSDKSEGPFLISGKVNDTQVYWRVNQQCQLVGTTNVVRSSPFYVIPTEHEYPCQFLVTYYGESKDVRYQPRHLNDPMIKVSLKQAPLSCYLTSNANMFGFSSQPLKLTSSASADNTRFCLQDKLTPSSLLCSSTTLVSPENWIEGEEFYINCSRGAFRIDGYLAMKRDLQNEKNDRADSLYTTVIVPTKATSGLGMLFRLHPVEYREIPQYEVMLEQLEPEGKSEQLKPEGEIPTEHGNESDLKMKQTISGAMEHPIISKSPLKSGRKPASLKQPPPKQSQYVSSYDKQYEQFFG